MALFHNIFDLNKNIKIEINKHYWLRIITPKDISDSYISWMNDYDVTKYTEQRFQKHSHEVIEKFVCEKFESPIDYLFGIFHKDKHIGNIKLGPVNDFHKIAEVSYFIGDRNYWGLGIATLAVNAVVKFGKNDLGLRKFNAGYYDCNIGSAKVLEKCGFEVEGVKKNEVIFENKRISRVLVGLFIS